MVIFALWMVPTLWRVVLSSATTVSGELSVMTSGVLLMQLWPVDSWDSPHKVSSLSQIWYPNKLWQLLYVPPWPHQYSYLNTYLSLGAVALQNAPFGQGTGPILLDNLFCTGTQLYLANCTHNGVGNHNCVHNEDAGLRCLANLVSKSPKLVGNSHISRMGMIGNGQLFY